MSDPLKANEPPDDVLPYAPTWARNPGYRATQSGVSYDAFSDEENPSYRSMAQMFAPQPERTTGRKKNSGMLLRFGGVVAIAGAALALFIGYVATRGGSETETAANAERFESVNNAVAAIQAALTPAPPPAAPKSTKQQDQVEASSVSIAPAPSDPPSRPVEAKLVGNADSGLATNRGAAPEAPPQVDSNLMPEPQSPPSGAAQQETATQVAALPSREIAPAPAPEPIVPQLTAGELATLMTKGRRFIEIGDFSSARPVYRRAAEAGYAEAALALGETYDPVTLEERGVVGMNGDIAQARRWYERAKELGSLEAPTRLERLPRD